MAATPSPSPSPPKALVLPPAKTPHHNDKYYFPINPSLKFCEEWITTSVSEDYHDDFNELGGPINFYITLPYASSSSSSAPSSGSIVNADNTTSDYDSNADNSNRLVFNCQKPSEGVLLPSEKKKQPKHDENDGDEQHDQQHEHNMSPFFFEKGFGLEAMTGQQLWPGSRLLIEQFTTCSSDDNGSNNTHEHVKEFKKRLQRRDNNNEEGGGLNILEVGAGIGAVGTCLAHAGGNVLMTDLKVLVDYGIRPNLKKNANNKNNTRNNLPEFLRNASSSSVIHNNGTTTNNNEAEEEESRDNNNEDGIIPIGKGYALAKILDWFQLPATSQLPLSTLSDIDVIIGCDCMFLRKLVTPLLSLVEELFELSSTSTTTTASASATATTKKKRKPEFWFTFQKRNMRGLFTTMEELYEEIVQKRKWDMECVAWREVDVDGEGGNELFLFRVVG